MRRHSGSERRSAARSRKWRGHVIRSVVIGLIAVVSAVAVAACGSSSGGGSSSSTSTSAAASTPTTSNSNLVVATFQSSLGNPYNTFMIDGARAEAKKLGIPYKSIIYNGSSQTQDSDLESFLSSLGPNQHAIIDITANADADMPVVAQDVAKAHSYLISFWQKPASFHPWNVGNSWVAAISYNGNQVGEGSGESLFKAMGGQGGFVEIDGLAGNTPTYTRKAGLQAAMKKYPGVKLLGSAYGDWTTPTAYTKTKTLIAKYGSSIKGVWAANDATAIGAERALQQANMTGVPVASASDAIPQSLTAIKDGTQLQTYSQHDFYGSALAVALGYYAATGKLNVGSLPHSKREFYLDQYPVTKANVAQYLATPTGTTQSVSQTLSQISLNTLFAHWAGGY